MEKKNLSAFRDYIKSKYRFAQMYANQLSKFGENNFRKKVFSIKSNLGNNDFQDEQLYIPINIARAVTRTFTNYVIGKGFSVDFGDNELNKLFVDISDNLKLQTLLNEAVDNQSCIGYSIIRVRSKDNTARVEIIPVANYLANMEGLTIWDGFEDIKEHFVFSVIKQNDRKVFYVDRYEKNQWGWNGYYGEIWDYNENFILSKRIEEAQTEENLEYLPIFLVNNDLKNSHTTSEDVFKDTLGNIPRYFAQSDYVDIADILQELNDRGSQISIEFVKNLTSKMSLPSSFKASEKAQGLRKVVDDTLPKKPNPDYILHGHGEQPAQYITKDGSYLSISIQHYIPMLLNFISLTTTIPTSMLGGEALFGGNNPVGTTEKEFERFYARVSSKQEILYTSLQKIFVAIMRASGKEVKKLPTIKFKKVQTWDVGQRTDIAASQMNMGIMSKISAMQFAMGYDEIEAKEEIKRINEETKDAYARDGGFLDTTQEENE